MNNNDLLEQLKPNYEMIIRLLTNGQKATKYQGGKELRFGNNGGLSIDTEKGIYQDFSTGESGGILALIEAKSGQNAIDWLVKNSFIKDTRGKSKDVDISALLASMNKAPQAVEKASNESVELLTIEATPLEAWERDYTEKVYTYTTKDGEPLYRIIKSYDDKGQRQFKQQRFDNDSGQWLNGLKHLDGSPAVTKTLYNLAGLTQSTSEPVYIVEGEKDVESLKNLGYVATTSGGSKSWQNDFADYLIGRDVVVLPDNDTVGSDYADAVIKSLEGKAASIKRVELSKHWKNMPEKYDVTDALEAGMTKQDLDAIVQSTPFFESSSDNAPAPKSRMEFVSVTDLIADRTPIKWQIKHFIQAQTMVEIFAAPAVGKSLIAIDWAASIATGKPWLGLHKVERGCAAIVAGEGVMGISKRVQAWQIENQTSLKGSHFYVSRTAETLDTTDGFEQTMLALNSLPVKPDFVVLDTLARTLAGDENSQQAMGAYIRAADTIKNHFNCTVVIVHHVGVSDSDRSRGSTSLPAACDITYLLKRDKDEIRSLICDKIKDAEKPKVHKFTLEPTGLGYFDEDDIEQTSAVLRFSGVSEGNKEETSKLSASNKFALDVFAQVSYQHKASKAQWRTAFYERHHGENTDTKKKAFDRAAKALTELGLIVASGDTFEIQQSHPFYETIKSVMIATNFKRTQKESVSANDESLNTEGQTGTN